MFCILEFFLLEKSRRFDTIFQTKVIRQTSENSLLHGEILCSFIIQCYCMPEFDPHELHLQVKKTINSREYLISLDFSWQYKLLSQASTTIIIFQIGFFLRCAGFSKILSFRLPLCNPQPKNVVVFLHSKFFLCLQLDIVLWNSAKEEQQELLLSFRHKQQATCSRQHAGTRKIMGSEAAWVSFIEFHTTCSRSFMV